MPKVTTDQCSELGAGWLMRNGILAPHSRRTANLNYDDAGEIGVAAQIGEYAGTLRLLYRLDGQGVPYATNSLGYDVKVISTALPWGKLRWLLVCPMCPDGADAVVKLYLPPGAKQFGCRKCHDLAYRSSQESRRLAVAG